MSSKTSKTLTLPLIYWIYDLVKIIFFLIFKMENDLEKIYDGFLYGIGFMGSLSLIAFAFFFIGIVFILIFSFFRKKL